MCILFPALAWICCERLGRVYSISQAQFCHLKAFRAQRGSDTCGRRGGREEDWVRRAAVNRVNPRN